jgi:hypothetical protein
MVFLVIFIWLLRILVLILGWLSSGGTSMWSLYSGFMNQHVDNEDTLGLLILFIVDNATAFDYILFIVFIELIFSIGANNRFEEDDFFRVITGFSGSGDYGYYSYNSNLVSRVWGWFFWLGAVSIRLYYLVIAISFFGVLIDPNFNLIQFIFDLIAQFFD